MRPLENAQENVRRLAENQAIILPHLKECCETQKSLHRKCNKCGVEYCSEQCQMASLAQYHQALCVGDSGSNHAIGLLMDYWKQIHLPPETTSIYLVLKLMAIMKQVI